MIRARPSLSLPLLALVPLAVAACKTERKPLTGFDKPPPGIILDDAQGGTVVIWTMFDLPAGEVQTFRPRLNGQDAVVATSDEGFYDYVTLTLSGWTAGWSNWLDAIPPGTYTVELADQSGQSWGQSPSLPIPASGGFQNPTGQFPAAIFSHFDGQAGSWTIDPSTQDSDPATDEITVTNLIARDVVVERCLITAGTRTSCTPIGTVPPQGDLRTVETPAASSKGDYPALFIHLASDATQSYERDLFLGSGTSWSFGSTCQIERIFFHGTREASPGANPSFSTAFAMSTCYGYGSGPSPTP